MATCYIKFPIRIARPLLTRARADFAVYADAVAPRNILVAVSAESHAAGAAAATFGVADDSDAAVRRGSETETFVVVVEAQFPDRGLPLLAWDPTRR